jgi:hypothetical protein
MNNIEKNLSEFYEKFFYPSSLEELLLYLANKLEKITLSGIKGGLTLDQDAENELVHRIMLEGIPFFISDKIKIMLQSYEESISEQPLLLAHPSSVKNEDYLNFIDDPKYIHQIVNGDYAIIHKKLYNSM